MNYKDLIKEFEKFAPLYLQEDFDNSGLQISPLEEEVTKAVVSLNLDRQSLELARSKGANMIFTHHPPFFLKHRNLNDDLFIKEFIKQAIREGIGFYSAHTNLDACKGGLSDYLGEVLGFNFSNIILENDRGCGYGRYGEKEFESLPFLANYVKEKLNSNSCYFVDAGVKPKRIGYIPGSGDDFIGACIEKGIDTLISSEFGEFEIFWASESKLNLIDVGHFPSENIVVDIFKNFLENFNIEVFVNKKKDIRISI